MRKLSKALDSYQVAVSVENGRNESNEGEAIKKGRLELLRKRRAVYVRRGQRALLSRLVKGGTATADDVHEVVELPPEIDPRCLGAVPSALARAGIIRSQGFVKSNRRARHASVIRVWALADRAAAEAWLVANPDSSDPDEESQLVANEKRPTAASDGRCTEPSRSKTRRRFNG